MLQQMIIQGNTSIPMHACMHLCMHGDRQVLSLLWKVNHDVFNKAFCSNAR